MAKVLFIIAQDGFRDEELLEPKKVLEDGSIECEIASITTDPATGKLGATVNPNLAVQEAHAENYAAIIVIGGPGAPELANYPEVINLLKAAIEQNKIVGAICIAPTILAQAGLLQGKRATVYLTPESANTLKANGVELAEEDVIIDGNFITANGPGAATQFGQTILEKLGA